MGYIVYERAHHASLQQCEQRTTVGLSMIGDASLKPLKKPLSYQEQIAHLQSSHGLHISDPAQAERILSRVNYYRLSAYGIGLYNVDGETFRDDVSLDTLHDLYEFDAILRNTLFSAIEEIEISLRTKIAYHVGMKYGPEGHMDSQCFEPRQNKRGEFIYDKFKSNVQREILHQGQTPIVKHHEHAYGGHYPIWVAVELFSFGTLSMFFSVMKPEDKKAIAEQFRVHFSFLESWIISLVEIRNLCAHYCRLYNRPLTKSPKLFTEHKRFHSDRIFPSVFMLGYLLENKNKWRVLVEDLVNLIGAYPDVKLTFIGFPDDWIDLLRAHPRRNG